MAKRPERRDLNGVLLFAKGAGPSSNQALQEVRRRLGWVKAGHAGTLDPAASGLLLVLLGEAVKLVPYLAGLEKEYVGVARFGFETDTQDAAGVPVRSAPWDHVTREKICAEMTGFLGASLQEPPMYSALQVGGRRLYDLARAGEQVERASRRIEVHGMRLLDWRPPEARFVVRVSTGTYVRTICRDLGVRCDSAAHLAALSRTAVGPFCLQDSISLEDLDALAPGASPPLVRLADALRHLPAVVLQGREASGVLEGRAPATRPAGEPADLPAGASLRLVDPEGRLLAVARFRDPAQPVELLRVFKEP